MTRAFGADTAMNKTAARHAPGGSSPEPPMISGSTNRTVIAANMNHNCRRVPNMPIQNTHNSATGATPEVPPARLAAVRLQPRGSRGSIRSGGAAGYS